MQTFKQDQDAREQVIESKLDYAHLDLLHSLRAMLDRAIDDHHRAARAEVWADYWQKEHARTQSEAIRSSEQTINGLLRMALTPGVLAIPGDASYEARKKAATED